ncbi:MAG: SLBB domain-containing protein [Nitrospirae bacterium]|nr:SLBB domain-containing protein [Nitrospirota bacterium]
MKNMIRIFIAIVSLNIFAAAFETKSFAADDTKTSASAQVKASASVLSKINAHDVIEIRVLDHPDLRTSVKVANDGSITFPYIGSVYVKGKNIDEVEKEIAKRLSEGYLKYPIVSVSLLQSNDQKVYVYGDTKRIGEIVFDEGLTVVKAISIAGGTDGLYGKVKVRRGKKGEAGYKEVTLDIKSIIEGGAEGYMPLLPDDIIVVDEDKIYIDGEVLRKGKFILRKETTVLKALLEAGGVASEGLYGKILVRRKQEGTPGGYKDFVEGDLINGIIESKEVENAILQPDDVLVVKHNKTYLVQGEVARPGRFILENNTTVLKALIEAGGAGVNGAYGKIKLRRKQEGTPGGYKDFVEGDLNNGIIESKEVENTILQSDDVMVVEHNKTYLVQGEVARPARFILENNTTVLKALIEAGGANVNGIYGKIKLRRKQEGEPGGFKDFAEAQLNEGLIENKEVESTLLQPDDILIIEHNKTFYIYGEVNNKVGEFVLQNNMTVFKAITTAGGVTKWGSESKIKILRPVNNSSGFSIIKVNIKAVIDGDASADIVLQPGDVIVVSGGIF